MSNEITLFSGNIECIDEVRELWEELNAFHSEKTCHFKQFYEEFTFEARKEPLLSSAARGELLVFIAYSGDARVGFCIASVVDGVGEIGSLFVMEGYRKKGVGHLLTEAALDWIKSLDAKKTIVRVACGNEEAFDFYAKYGFLPRATELQLAP